MGVCVGCRAPRPGLRARAVRRPGPSLTTDTASTSYPVTWTDGPGDLRGLAQPARTGRGELAVCAFSLIAPRNRIDKITRKLALLP